MILKGAQLAEGTFVDIQIQNGLITEIGSISETGIDCQGLVALPGLVDLHTHLREPGFEQSETIESGSRSAAAGGYTAVFAMANTNPVQDTPELCEWVLDRGASVNLVKVQPIGAITKSIAGQELSPLSQMASSRARVRVFSDDGNCLMDPDLMRSALQEVKKFGGVIAQHSQDHSKTIGSLMNDGELSNELGLAGWPRLAEEDIIARDAQLALETDSRLHVCHVTTEGAVDAVRWAKSKGVRITAEVTPHHLLLTEDLVRSYDPVYKVNPPLRTKRDTQALREALIDGTIDVIATDHAPHSSEKKQCEWANAAFGMIGLEVAASVLYQVLIRDGGSDWSRFAMASSISPAKIGGLDGFGEIAVGKPANLMLFDPASSKTISAPTNSLSSNNPWMGHKLVGEVIHTLYRGRFTFSNGAVNG
jgi:dihydroorotase